MTASSQEGVPAWFSDALNSAPDQATVTVDGAAITYRAWGPAGAPGILLVHGGAAHAGWWDHLGPRLAAGHRVVALDLSGHGDSDWREGYTYDQWAVELVAVARAAGIAGDLTVVGHSMGGITAMRAAVRFPEIVNRVVVVDSELFDAEDIARLMAHGPPADIAIPRTARHYATRAEALARYRLLPEHDTLAYAREHVAQGSVTRDERGWRWKFDRSFPTLLTDPAPTPPPGCALTVVRAEHGVMDSDKARRLVESRPPGTAVLVTVPEAGHHVLLDRPEELLAVLHSALGHRVGSTANEEPYE